MNRRGFALLLLILVMVLLAITALGLATFVTQRLHLVCIRQDEINAYYMAQAGIYNGIYHYETSGGTVFVGDSGKYGYSDRGFNWRIIPIQPDIIRIESKGYSGTSGIVKTLEARYNTNNDKFDWLGYHQG